MVKFRTQAPPDVARGVASHGEDKHTSGYFSQRYVSGRSLISLRLFMSAVSNKTTLGVRSAKSDRQRSGHGFMLVIACACLLVSMLCASNQALASTAPAQSQPASLVLKSGPPISPDSATAKASAVTALCAYNLAVIQRAIEPAGNGQATGRFAAALIVSVMISGTDSALSAALPELLMPIASDCKAIGKSAAGVFFDWRDNKLTSAQASDALKPMSERLRTLQARVITLGETEHISPLQIEAYEQQVFDQLTRGLTDKRLTLGNALLVSVTQTPQASVVTKTVAAPVPTAPPQPAAVVVPAAGAVHLSPTYSDGKGSPNAVVSPAWWPCKEGQVKANNNSGIYHVPTGQFYAKTFKNVTCFDTPGAAAAAGFRPSKR